jgi:dipeptidase E
MVGLGWKSLGVLELTALPSLDKERWVPMIRETDVLLVDGGDAAYLCHWMRASGLADLLPSLRETVWVGVSAGSMVMTPRIGEDFVNWHSPAGRQNAGRGRFLDLPARRKPGSAGEHDGRGRTVAAGLSGPAYAIDDENAIKVVDGTVEVVSEGRWKLLTHSPEAS